MYTSFKGMAESVIVLTVMVVEGGHRTNVHVNLIYSRNNLDGLRFYLCINL